MPTATHLTIANAVKTAVDTLAISSLTTIVRAKTSRGQGDTMPLCIVTMGREIDTGYLTGGMVLRGYEIIVTVLEVSNQKLQTNIGDAKLVRDQVRTGLFPAPGTTLLTGVSTIWNVEIEELPPQNPSDFDANYMTSQIALLYHNSEAL